MHKRRRRKIAVIPALVVVAGLLVWYLWFSVAFYGQVVDNGGQAVAGARVNVLVFETPIIRYNPFDVDGRAHSPERKLTLVTDSDGIFRLRGQYDFLLVMEIVSDKLKFDVDGQHYEFYLNTTAAERGSSEVTDTGMWSPQIFRLR